MPERFKVVWILYKCSALPFIPFNSELSRSLHNTWNIGLSGWQMPGLFDGCSFYLLGEFEQPTPPREDLACLMTLGGGTVLHREPTVDMINQSPVSVPYHVPVTSSLANCSHYIVSADERDVTLVTGGRMCRVPPSWIMTCIAEFRLVDRLWLRLSCVFGRAKKKTQKLSITLPGNIATYAEMEKKTNMWKVAAAVRSGNIWQYKQWFVSKWAVS